jgi:phage-related protein
MAHETTHVVQQRGGMRAAQREISATTPRVQRFWNPISAISNAVSSAVEWVGETVGDAVNYLKERAAEFVRSMPGYRLFTVVYGSDPISGGRVERNGRNFIEAGLDIIPNGESLKQKLEEEGALAEAAQWLDNELLALDFSPSEIASQFAAFWSSLSISDVTRLPEVMQRFANIFLDPLERIRRFAINVASELLRIIKNYVVNALIGFIREHTNAYPLLTVILGRDPISGEAVERTPVALLRGFMQLSESGQEQLRQMEESGSLQRAAEWLDGAVERLNITWEVIRETFSAAWEAVTIQRLLNPPALFVELYNIFAGPVGRILAFVWEIAVAVLGFIKDALIGRLVAYAHTVRGYPLISVILGRDPLSQESAERTTPNIIRGFLSLMENGEQQYQEMEQSGAIARMSARIEAAMAVLNFTWEYIRGLFARAWNAFSLQDLAAPLEAFARLMAIFGAPILRLVAFVGEIIRIVIEVIMEVMNFPIDLIRNIITRALQAIDDIQRDPIGFLKNLLRAVKTGFEQFFGNILQHLLNGLTGWLFSELREANVNPPTDLSFRSILGFVLEVLGITVERIWQKLAERIGEERVARIRGMIDRLSGIWSFVRDVATRGPVAIWEYIQERLSSLWDTVLESVRNWVVTRIVERVVTRLLSMLDPTGIMAVINGFIAFYNAVQSFIRYLREMLEIVNSFVSGVADIARGSVAGAANYLEGALAQGMPVAIGFLANQVGLSGIGRRIGEMIESVRALVDRALSWLVDRAVSAGSSLLNMGRNAVASVVDWWRLRKNFRTESGESHSLHFQGQGAGAQLIMQSDPVDIRRWITLKRATPNLSAQKQTALGNVERLANEIDTIKGDSSTNPRPMEQVLDELATQMQALMGSDTLAEAKIHPDFSSGWFRPGDLYQFIMNTESVSRSTAGNRVNAWNDDVRTWQSHENDPYKKFSFVEASKERIVPNTSRRTLFGFGNNIEKDSSSGWAVMIKTIDRDHSQTHAIQTGYKTAQQVRADPNWFSAALGDERFRKTAAVFECARRRHGKGTRNPFFGWGPAIMGHDDSQHEGAAGYWNQTGHRNDRAANADWNRQVSSYWGPEHTDTSSWSGGFAPDYNDPATDSHPSWWNRNSPNWYGKVNASYTFFLDE